jgi:Rrf2 family nitric oxide-sensitive transcriptional repressor
VRLTRYTEYSLRVLLYLGLRRDRLCSISEIATAYRISESHLTKVVQGLGRQGFIETQRGRGGGLRLAKPPEAIPLADVIRRNESGLENPDCANCPLVPACRLTGILNQALRAFVQVFEAYTLADILGPGDRMLALLDESLAQQAPSQ